MPANSSSIFYCCHCGLGPWNTALDAHCQGCGRLRCVNCLLYSNTTGSSDLVHRTRTSEFTEAEKILEPISTNRRELSPESPDRQQTTTVGSHYQDSDVLRNPLSAERISETHSRVAPSVETIAPNNLQTFTTILSQSQNPGVLEAVEHGKEEVVKGIDHPEIQSERPPRAKVTGQPIQSSSTSPGAHISETYESSRLDLVHAAPKQRVTPDRASRAAPEISFEAQLGDLTSETTDGSHRGFQPGRDSPVASDDKPWNRLKTRATFSHTEDHGSDREWGLDSEESVAFDTLSDTSTRACGMNEQRNSGKHVEDNLEHLDTLLRRLSIQQDTARYSVILQVCSEIWEYAQYDADGRETQNSPATSISENSTQSSRPFHKRSRQQSEDSDSEKNGTKRSKTSTTGSPDPELKRMLACPFYKANPYVYSACGTFRGANISTWGAHLSKKHIGRANKKSIAKGFHCEQCCKLFNNDQQLAAHRCRPTRGPCVCKIDIPKTQGVDMKERFEEVWSILFPDMRKPKSPWWSNDDSPEQIILSVMKKMRDEGEWHSFSGCGSLKEDIISGWHIIPPEHLPDLLQEHESVVVTNKRGRERPELFPPVSPSAASPPGTLQTFEAKLSDDPAQESTLVNSLELGDCSSTHHSRGLQNVTSSLAQPLESLSRSSNSISSAPAEEIGSFHPTIRENNDELPVLGDNSPVLELDLDEWINHPESEVDDLIAGVNISAMDFPAFLYSYGVKSIFNNDEYEKLENSNLDFPIPVDTSLMGQFELCCSQLGDDSAPIESNSHVEAYETVGSTD
ncbi:hypothetical protein HD806DRAFT_551314 [Xylariaceae sp. AK1471]|nr:hypothetical protein HD806DRAFT_551314 [Xylariaceae sp. AK1471]